MINTPVQPKFIAKKFDYKRNLDKIIGGGLTSRKAAKEEQTCHTNQKKTKRVKENTYIYISAIRYTGSVCISPQTVFTKEAKESH